MDRQSKIILISGPTASGKSNFAVKLSQKVNGEIINADSMQVYKQLNILTARPKKKIKRILNIIYMDILILIKDFQQVIGWKKQLIK